VHGKDTLLLPCLPWPFAPFPAPHAQQTVNGAVALHLTLPNINQSRNAIKNHNAADNKHKPTTTTVSIFIIITDGDCH
jgi:hypothetical protein